MGRPAQPAALQLLKGRGAGTDSGGRKVKTPPAFRRIAPNPPTWISREAKAEWKRVAPGLQRLDLLKEEDRATLAAYCETWSTYVLATRDVTRRGLTVQMIITTRDGTVTEKEMANPSVAIARNAGKELRAWAIHYGLTPSAEMALGKAADDGEEDENPFG
ncbi:phage terminase small subunit P27 family [Nocardioides marmoraquaticus]